MTTPTKEQTINRLFHEIVDPDEGLMRPEYRMLLVNQLEEAYEAGAKDERQELRQFIIGCVKDRLIPPTEIVSLTMQFIDSSIH